MYKFHLLIGAGTTWTVMIISHDAATGWRRRAGQYSTAPRIVSVVVLAMALSTVAQGQTIATLEVPPDSSMANLDLPLRIHPDAFGATADSRLGLVKVVDGERRAVRTQIEIDSTPALRWVISGSDRGRHLRYGLVAANEAALAPVVRIIREDGPLVVYAGDQPVLAYHPEIVYPSNPADSIHARSGFIHPLWSPAGQVLTRIQPPDHLHHYGIWNPWTHVQFEGEIVDFWNLYKRQGTVRFVELVSVLEGPVFGQFEVLHEHVVFQPDGSEKVAMMERQTIRVYAPSDDDHYIIDLMSELTPAGESPVRLLTYRYGGLGWRTTGEWSGENSEVLTSEGRTRNDADSTRARWIMVQGDIEGEHAGAVVASHPSNFNHPEPVRVWPDDMYEKGDLFLNYSPTKNTDWLLVPGQSYTLKYRFISFSGRFSRERAEQAWRDFAETPDIRITWTAEDEAGR